MNVVADFGPIVSKVFLDFVIVVNIPCPDINSNQAWSTDLNQACPADSGVFNWSCDAIGTRNHIKHEAEFNIGYGSSRLCFGEIPIVKAHAVMNPSDTIINGRSFSDIGRIALVHE